MFIKKLKFITIKILKKYAKNLLLFGIDLKVLLSYKNYFRFRADKKKWIEQGGKIFRENLMLQDYEDNAGNTKGHYFHQDLLVANMIFEAKPKRHLDVGSRIDGFIAHVASFREIEVIDIRPLKKSIHKNIKFIQKDLMKVNYIKKTESLSCLHAIEHFGLGRYNDEIDVDGHIKGIDNLVSLLSNGGILYLSFPIGKKDEVYFNAHRIFHPKSILKVHSIYKYMQLVRFDYVDDYGNLHLKKNIESPIEDLSYGCGIYTFKKR